MARSGWTELLAMLALTLVSSRQVSFRVFLGLWHRRPPLGDLFGMVSARMHMHGACRQQPEQPDVAAKAVWE